MKAHVSWMGLTVLYHLLHLTMRFVSTAKVLANCKLKYYRISECTWQDVKPLEGPQQIYKLRKEPVEGYTTTLEAVARYDPHLARPPVPLFPSPLWLVPMLLHFPKAKTPP